MIRLQTYAALLLAGLASIILAACGAAPGAAPTAAPTAMPGGMAGMDHSGMAGMSDAPYDAAFIDSMIAHHEGAIAMARDAQAQAERQEIKDLAQAIITAQESEIAQLRTWRAAWYPDLAATAGMGMEMGTMMVAAGDAPFDQRFIQAMIPHHESAVTMARDAQTKAEHQEIKDLSGAIIGAQESEIAQMRQWLKDWYGIAP